MSKTFTLGSVIDSNTGKPRALLINPEDLHKPETEWDKIYCIVKPTAESKGMLETLRKFAIQDATFSPEAISSDTAVGNKLKTLTSIPPNIITHYAADKQFKNAVGMLQVLSTNKDGQRETPTYAERWRMGVDQTYINLVGCEDAARVQEVLKMPGFKEFTKAAPPTPSTFTLLFKELSSRFGNKSIDKDVSKNLLKVAELNPKAYSEAAKVYDQLKLPVLPTPQLSR